MVMDMAHDRASKLGGFERVLEDFVHHEHPRTIKLSQFNFKKLTILIKTPVARWKFYGWTVDWMRNSIFAHIHLPTFHVILQVPHCSSVPPISGT